MRHTLAVTDRVLVAGYRAGLCDALDRLGVAYVIWTATPIINKRRQSQFRVRLLDASQDKLREHARSFAGDGPFTHVIAGTEAGVVAASIARRELGARKSVHATILKCHDKLKMKSFLTERGVPMVDFIPGRSGMAASAIIDRLGTPVVIKDRASSGGRGIEFASSTAAVADLSGRGRIMERYIDAPEISVESFVSDSKIQLESMTNYHVKKFVNVVPAGFDADLTRRILELNRKVIRELRISWGVTHHEMYLGPDGPLFGEIALRPPGGYIMELIQLAYGFDPWMAFAMVELGRAFDFPGAARRVAAAVLLHPGEGRVAAIRGADEVHADPAVERFKLRVESGDLVRPRTGVGVDVGHVLLAADDRTELMAAVERVRTGLQVELC